MTELDHARALYEDAAEVTNGQTIESLAATLEHRARLVRGEQEAQDVRETSTAVRGEIAEALTDVPFQQRERIADQLEQTAETLRDVFGQAAPKAQELPGDTAAEAQLESSEMRVDTRKLAAGEGKIVDKQVATDIRDHELEHNQQSVHADADEITLDHQPWEQGEVREIAAISVQKRTDFLSVGYQRLARVNMNARERELVRKGQFRRLEAERNGTDAVAA